MIVSKLGSQLLRFWWILIIAATPHSQQIPGTTISITQNLQLPNHSIQRPPENTTNKLKELLQ
jgi:hypothetical protein